MMAEPWQRAETAGPVKATLVNSVETAADLLAKFGHPSVSIGSEKLDGDLGYVGQVGRLCKAIGACTTSSSPSVLNALREGGLDAKPFSPLELSERLGDPSWMGLDGKGRHDLAIFLGFRYYYSWLMLSGLKSFAREHLKTFSLDPYYQPHASYSLPNFPVKARWASFMEGLATALESKRKVT
jgi:acetyl-CoA decarbonylase/synthase complex subunit epsilon